MASSREARSLGGQPAFAPNHQLPGSHLWVFCLVTVALNGSICCKHTPAPNGTDKEIRTQMRKPEAHMQSQEQNPRDSEAVNEAQTTGEEGREDGRKL